MMEFIHQNKQFLAFVVITISNNNNNNNNNNNSNNNNIIDGTYLNKGRLHFNKKGYISFHLI